MPELVNLWMRQSYWTPGTHRWPYWCCSCTCRPPLVARVAVRYLATICRVAEEHLALAGVLCGGRSGALSIWHLLVLSELRAYDLSPLQYHESGGSSRVLYIYELVYTTTAKYTIDQHKCNPQPTTSPAIPARGGGWVRFLLDSNFKSEEIAW